MATVPEVTPPSKPWFTSRIVIVNVVSIAAAVLVYLAGVGVFEGLGLTPGQALIARNWVMLLMAVLNAATVALRFDTTRTIR